MANPFDDERDFVSDLQENATWFYNDFFGPHSRFQVEEVGDGELEKQLDFSGVDQIIKPDNSPITIHVAQRFRRRREDGPTDFSIRCKSNGVPTEYSKLIRNHANARGHLPGAYAFGIVEDDGSFGDFYFLSVDMLAKALKQDAVRKDRHKNFVNGAPDGTEAYYIPVKDLRDCGIIIGHYAGRGERAL